jgi:hypothetical protein
MTTAKKPPSYSKWLDDMRASARMRARLMKKIPKPAELPRRSVDMTKASPPGQRLALAGAMAAPVGSAPTLMRRKSRLRNRSISRTARSGGYFREL